MISISLSLVYQIFTLFQYKLGSFDYKNTKQKCLFTNYKTSQYKSDYNKTEQYFKSRMTIISYVDPSRLLRLTGFSRLNYFNIKKQRNHGLQVKNYNIDSVFV